MSYIYDLTDTWNNGATTFTAIKMNVTNTASNAASLLMDLQVGTVSKFSVRNDGRVTTGDLIASNIYGGGLIQVTSGAGRFDLGGDVLWFRDEANIAAQRNGANAQTKRVYGTYTDASNYRRVAITMSTAGTAEIKPEGAGTGASGNVLHISGLPTSNPGAGILWNDAGTVKVGT